MKEGASIILHLDCLSAVDCLTDEQSGVLFKGLLRYANTGEPLLSPDSALQAVFALFRAQIDRDTKKIRGEMQKEPSERMQTLSEQERWQPKLCDRMRWHATASERIPK